jgi:DNA primase
MDVETLLIKKDIQYIPKGKDFVVRCLNPEHEDRNPSMKIDQITGIYQCFSCGYKGNILNNFGERANQLQLRRDLFKKKLTEKRAESVGLSFPQNCLPFIGTWRGIKPETFKKFEAFTHHHSADFKERINFPIRDISGKIVGFQGRHRSAGLPKYKFSPTGVKVPFFPIVEAIQSTVILVEGLFDMLNLHDKGLTNTVCCFGTNNFSERKLSMLSVQGVEHVFIFFDNDTAGQKAATELKPLCENAGLTSKNIVLKGIKDPGELPKEKVEELKRNLYG